jgi:vacuolar-type H+-ATPase subunit F/Vma7
MNRLNVQVICRPELAAGFALAGVVPIEVNEADDVAAHVRGAYTRSGIGVILVQDDLLPDDRMTIRTSELPMIVPFPGPRSLEAMESPATYVAEILRRAIGYRVRLE